jgi:hypothetical protein
VTAGEPDFASGSSGQIVGIRLTSRAVALDAAYDLISFALLVRPRLRRAAASWPGRRVLALGIERTGEPNVLDRAFAELRRSRHDVTVVRTDAGSRGKFENLNELLAKHPADGYDWLLVVDDDVTLPAGFLDAFVVLAERFGLSLAQPAHRRRSHAAWEVTRRRPASLVRETRFVEIGPLFALNSRTFDTLLPFPPLRIGWGLDAHWSALAKERGWKLGVIDATPVHHGIRPIAASYDHETAFDEAREFLAGRPYTRADEAQRTITTHRWLR